MCVQYDLLDTFYLAKSAQDYGLNCINSSFELVTVKSDRTRCCCGSEAGFTDGASAWYCVFGFKNKHKKSKWWLKISVLQNCKRALAQQCEKKHLAIKNLN